MVKNWLYEILRSEKKELDLVWPENLYFIIKDIKINIEEILIFIECMIIEEYNDNKNSKSKHKITFKKLLSSLIQEKIITSDEFHKLFEENIYSEDEESIDINYDIEANVISSLFTILEPYFINKNIIFEFDKVNHLLIIDLEEELNNFKLSIFERKYIDKQIQLEYEIFNIVKSKSLYKSRYYNFSIRSNDNKSTIILKYPKLISNTAYGKKIDKINKQWEKFVLDILKCSLFICDLGYLRSQGNWTFLPGIMMFDKKDYFKKIQKVIKIIEFVSFHKSLKFEKSEFKKDLDFLSQLMQRIFILPDSRSYGELHFNIVQILEYLSQSSFIRKFETSLRIISYIRKELKIMKNSEGFNLLLKNFDLRNKFAHGNILEISSMENKFNELKTSIHILFLIIHKILDNISIIKPIDVNMKLFDSIYDYSNNEIAIILDS